MVRKTSVIFAACAMLFAGRASAGTIDLTTANSSGSDTAAIGGVYQAFWVNQQTTGTGVIEPFSRLQNGGNEQGFNTDLAVSLDEKAGIWTHALLLADVPIVNLGGTDYRQFLLDINEDKGSNHEFLTLNQVQIFQANADQQNTSLSPASPANQPIIGFAAATEIFRMNNQNGTNAIELNFLLNPGSGAGDMFLYIPDTDFIGQKYVILYSQFGSPKGSASSSDGFEEWAVIGEGGGDAQGQSADVPEPASLLLLGSGLAFVARRARRKKA